MPLKDYYRILDIEPSASYPEIRKAFRKLAHQYHPDKNQKDPYAAAQFADIKEAYEVLTNPAKKEYYLQQRWYNQSAGKRKTQTPVTPVSVLIQFLELDKYVSTVDIHRMDKQGLADHIRLMLSDNVVALLLPFNEPHIQKQIILIALRAMGPLKLKQASVITTELYKLAGEDAESKENISDFIIRKNQQEKAEKKQPFVVLIIVLIICFLIWLMGR